MLYPYRKSTWAVILFLLVGWPAFSILVSSTGEVPASIRSLSLEVYLPTLLIQILLILLIIWTLSRSKDNFASVGLARITLTNLILGIALYLFAQALFFILSLMIQGLDQSPDLKQYLPRTASDYFLWIMLSASAALGEEMSFRGFLITRLTPVLGNFGAAALLSSIAFALGHAYQGLVGVIFTGVYGLLFSLMLFWRKSIFPCMIAHFLQDALTPFLYNLTQGPTN